MSNNIFNKPTTNSETKTEQERIKPKDIDQDDLFDLIEEYEDIGNKSKKLTSRIDIIKYELRDIALIEYLRKYEEDKKNPGSIMIEAISEKGDIGQYMFVPSDRYITIKTEEQADELEKKYGKGLVERSLIYSFDPKMLEKYLGVISDLIKKCDDIEEEDKGKLFIGTESYKVVSGTINELHSLETSDIKEIFDELKPVVSLKNAEVIKS